MKKLAAILLLILLLFNLVGYKLCFYYVQQAANVQLQQSLDNETYNEQDLITIRVPLSLPYQTDRKDFERVDGEIDLNGQIYTYVKRKVSQGELILLCLPNHSKMQLETAKADFFKIANNLQNSTPVKKPLSSATSLVNVLSDYDHTSLEWALNTAVTYLKSATPDKENSLLTRSSYPPEQPPELL